MGVLGAKITAEKKQLEKRLEQFGRLPSDRSTGVNRSGAGRERRPYPRVLPKFRNPLEPSETWSGRGKKPRWMTKLLKSGRRWTTSGLARRSCESYRAARPWSPKGAAVSSFLTFAFLSLLSPCRVCGKIGFMLRKDPDGIIPKQTGRSYRNGHRWPSDRRPLKSEFLAGGEAAAPARVTGRPFATYRQRPSRSWGRPIPSRRWSV